MMRFRRLSGERIHSLYFGPQSFKTCMWEGGKPKERRSTKMRVIGFSGRRRTTVGDISTGEAQRLFTQEKKVLVPGEIRKAVETQNTLRARRASGRAAFHDTPNSRQQEFTNRLP